MKNNRFILNLIIFIMMIGIYFSLVDNPFKMRYFLIVGVALIIGYSFLVYKNNNIKINGITLALISVFAIFFVSAIYFSNANGIKYSIYFILGVLYFLFLQNIEGIPKILLKNLKIFSFLFAITTILSVLFKEIFQSIYLAIFSYKRYSFVMSMLNNGKYSGIAGQTGLNAYLISIGLVLNLTELIFGNKIKVKNVIICILQIIAVLLTAKRAFLIYNLAIVMLMLLKKTNKNIIYAIKKIPTIICVILALILIINTVFPTGLKAIERFSIQKNDISNGRFYLYKFALSLLKQNLTYGIGICNFSNMIGLDIGQEMDVHNVFIQLLTELGLIQGIYVIIVLLYILKKAINIAKKEKNIKNNSGMYLMILFYMYFLTGNSLFDVQMLYVFFISLALIFNKETENINE